MTTAELTWQPIETAPSETMVIVRQDCSRKTWQVTAAFFTPTPAKDSGHGVGWWRYMPDTIALARVTNPEPTFWTPMPDGDAVDTFTAVVADKRGHLLAYLREVLEELADDAGARFSFEHWQTDRSGVKTGRRTIRPLTQKAQIACFERRK